MSSEVKYALTVKEDPEGLVYLVFEPHEDIGLEKTIIGLDLNKGTSVDEAQKVAEYIRTHISRPRIL